MRPPYPAHLSLPKHRRSLALHERIAAKIRHDPTLLGKARDNLGHWIEQNSLSRSMPYLLEWRELFDHDLDAVLAVMIDSGEHANNLRPSAPFAGILTEDERLAFLAEWRACNPPG